MNCVSCVSLMRMHAHGSMLGLNGEIKHITNKYVLRLMHLLSMFQERRDIAHLKYQSSLNSGNHLGYPIPLIHHIAWVIAHEQIHINQQALASTVVHVRRRQPIAHALNHAKTLGGSWLLGISPLLLTNLGAVTNVHSFSTYCQACFMVLMCNLNRLHKL